MIPRDAVPEKGLLSTVIAATFPLPRSSFIKESWTLEPKPVMSLLDKIRRSGVPLMEFAGVKPFRGILTGFNQAFLIDTPTRDRLVDEDPGCAEIIKPYLRGQDIHRWSSPNSGLFMIVMKSSSDFAWPWANVDDEKQAESLFKKTYPSLHSHMKQFEELEDIDSGKKGGLRHREDHGRYWWELRSCAYYDSFVKPKVLYVGITWRASFSLDRSGRFTNNTAYFIPTGDPWIAAVLNAPVGWWFAWRKAQHGKDEALRYFTSFVEQYPIPTAEDVNADVERIAALRDSVQYQEQAIKNWLCIEFGFEKSSAMLTESHKLDADGFVGAVKKILPKSRKMSAAEISRIRKEYTATIEPARKSAAEALAIERRLSDLVNSAYNLTPEEVNLMWDTAPPRMPFRP